MVKEESRMLSFPSPGTVYIVCGSFNPGRIQLSIEEKTLKTFLYQFSSKLVRSRLRSRRRLIWRVIITKHEKIKAITLNKREKAN